MTVTCMLRAVGRACLTAALVVVLGACGVTSLHFATPPATPPSSTTSTTTSPDLTGIAQNKVSGRTTTTTVAIGPGKATLTGTVVGPQGPVGGATVEADRIVGFSVATKRAITAADGSWSLPSILGGRYRVRAWQTPSLAMTDPQIFFLGGNQSMPVGLQVQSFAGQTATSAGNPQSAGVGGTITVVVAVSSQSVDDNGVVSYRPAPGVSVELTGSGNVSFGADPVTTDGSGNANFTVTCLTAGSAGVTGTTAGGASTALSSLQCTTPFIPFPTAPTTSPTTSPSTSVPGSSTTTTPAGAGGSVP